MAIIIRNLGGDMSGVCNYEVRINDHVVSTFTHDRSDGLSKCLRVAAASVDKARDSEVARLSKLFNDPWM